MRQTMSSIETARTALAALQGNVTHRPTDHEVALAEALTALVSDHQALLDARDGDRFAEAWERGADAALEAVMSPDPGQPFRLPTNPYRPEHSTG